MRIKCGSSWPKTGQIWRLVRPIEADTGGDDPHMIRTFSAVFNDSAQLGGNRACIDDPQEDQRLTCANVILDPITDPHLNVRDHCKTYKSGSSDHGFNFGFIGRLNK